MHVCREFTRLLALVFDYTKSLPQVMADVWMSLFYIPPTTILTDSLLVQVCFAAGFIREWNRQERDGECR